MSNRKRLQMFLVISLVFSVLSGCKNLEKQDDPQTDVETTVETSETEGTETMAESITELKTAADTTTQSPVEEQTRLTQPPVLTLQDALSSTMAVFELNHDTASWNYKEKDNSDTMVGFVSCGTHPLAAAEEKNHLILPRYNQMDFVSYMVSSPVLPDQITVTEYDISDFEASEDLTESSQPVSTKTYEAPFLIDLKPGMGYVITAQWDEEHLDVRGFYGTGYYSLIAD